MIKKINDNMFYLIFLLCLYRFHYMPKMYENIIIEYLNFIYSVSTSENYTLRRHSRPNCVSAFIQ